MYPVDVTTTAVARNVEKVKYWTDCIGIEFGVGLK